MSENALVPSEHPLLCTFCGYRIPVACKEELLAGAGLMAEHITSSCPKHPLAILRREHAAVLTALNDIVEAERGYRQAGTRADENIWSEALRERCEAARHLIPEDF